MNEEEAIENVKKQLEGIKKANECGLATRGEFNKDIEAIETVLNLLEKKEKEIKLLNKMYKQKEHENKELKTITNQFEAYECEASKDSKAKIIIADKFYFNNGYFKNNFIEIDKIKRVFEDFEKIMKEGEENV